MADYIISPNNAHIVMTRAAWDATHPDFTHVREDGTHSRLALDPDSGATCSYPVRFVDRLPVAAPDRCPSNHWNDGSDYCADCGTDLNPEESSVTDCTPTPKGKRPHTVLLMLPDDMRGDECCEADWLRREWVWSFDVEDAIEEARMELARRLEWADLDCAELAERKETLAPVAVYAGHQFDMFQP